MTSTSKYNLGSKGRVRFQVRRIFRIAGRCDPLLQFKNLSGHCPSPTMLSIPDKYTVARNLEVVTRCIPDVNIRWENGLIIQTRTTQDKKVPGARSAVPIRSPRKFIKWRVFPFIKMLVSLSLSLLLSSVAFSLPWPKNSNARSLCRRSVILFGETTVIRSLSFVHSHLIRIRRNRKLQGS